VSPWQGHLALNWQSGCTTSRRGVMAERRSILVTTIARRGSRFCLRCVRVFNWRCHAWCQMTNHYHLLVETPDANLARCMRQLNGVYTEFIKRTHGRVGHLFQGRCTGILVEGDNYLLVVARYSVLSPVRARMVGEPDECPGVVFGR